MINKDEYNKLIKYLSKQIDDLNNEDDIDEELYNSIFNDAIDEVMPEINSIIKNIKNMSNDDYDLLKRNLHTLKGSMRTLGLYVLGAVINRLEEILFYYNYEDIDNNAIKLIEFEYNKIVYLINKYMSNYFTLNYKEREWILHNKDNSINFEVDFNKNNDDNEITVKAENDNYVKIKYSDVDKYIDEAIKIRSSKNNINDLFNNVFTNLNEFKMKYQTGSINNEHDLTYFFNQLFHSFDRNKILIYNHIKNQNILTQNIIKNLSSLRTIKFGDYTNRFYKVVNIASKEMKKTCQLIIKNEFIELDKELFDKITPAIEHILRNCVAHGIENKKERSKSNKNDIGTITIDIKSLDNYIILEINDDGNGIDLQKIINESKKHGHNVNTDEEAIDIIFKPGITTSTNKTNISGMGVGLDVVKTIIDNIGGHISVKTEKSIGTSFIMTFPIDQTISNILIVNQNQQFYGIPNNIIKYIKSYNKKDYFTYIKDKSTINIENKDIPIINFSLLMGTKIPSETKRYFKVIFLKYLDLEIALVVDEIGDNLELILKNVGKLNKINGVIGASLLSNSNSALIVNPILMYNEYIKNNHNNKNNMVNEKYSLIVDDSRVVCTIQKNTLSKAGIKAITLYNGKTAIDYIQDNIENLPTVIITDLDMPILNGMDLVKAIKSNEQTKHIPVIMITSKSITKYKDDAIKNGVDLFLSKPFDNQLLINSVKKYLNSSY